MKPRDVRTSRTDVRAHTVVRFHTSVEWYVGPFAAGHYVSGWIDCTHDHMNEEAAAKCRSRLEHRIVHNPHLFPDVQRALQDLGRERSLDVDS